MSASRRDAEDMVLTWLRDVVGAEATEHIEAEDVQSLLDRLGWPHPDEELDPGAVAAVRRERKGLS